ncbi:MAG: hypothetical protein WC867_01105 [Candidatus Pacearchaeota archaeon]|jgi:phosphomannomutase
MQYNPFEFDKLAKLYEKISKLDNGYHQLDSRGKNIPKGSFSFIGNNIANKLLERNEKYFMLSGDGRINTPIIIDELTEELTKKGINVIYAGYNNTTPMFDIERERLGISGAMITASHQRPEFNGIKLIFNSLSNKPKLAHLMNEIRNGSKVIYAERLLKEDYIDRLDKKIGVIESGSKIIYDALQGTSFEIFKELASRKGVKYYSFRETPNPFFRLTSGSPDPSNPDNFKKLSESIKDILEHDFIAIVDGDGDRFGLAIDDYLVPPPIISALRAEFSGCDKFVTEYCVSSIIKDYLNKRGIEVIERKRGRNNIIPICKENLIPGSEISLHNFGPDGIDDGVYNTFEFIHLSQKLKNENKTLREKIKEMGSEIRGFYPEIRVDTENNSAELVNKLSKINSYSSYPNDDGIRIDNNEYGLFIRGSSNENSLTLNLNWIKGNESKAQKKLEEVFNELNKIEPGLREKLQKRLEELL